MGATDSEHGGSWAGGRESPFPGFCWIPPGQLVFFFYCGCFLEAEVSSSLCHLHHSTSPSTHFPKLSFRSWTGCNPTTTHNYHPQNTHTHTPHGPRLSALRTQGCAKTQEPWVLVRGQALTCSLALGRPCSALASASTSGFSDLEAKWTLPVQQTL